MAAAALSLRGSILSGNSPPARAVSSRRTAHQLRRTRWCGPGPLRPYQNGRAQPLAPAAGSRADDSSAPNEMTVESALELLGVAEGASFDEVLRAKNAVLTSCRDDVEAATKVEAAYDTLLMRSLSRRRAGKVASSNIRYADVKLIRTVETGALQEWLQNRVKNIPISVDPPSTNDLGIQAAVYGALMFFIFVSGSSPDSSGPYTGADVPGLILAASFGASFYFLSKKRIRIGKAAAITIGGLVVGAATGWAVEQWLQVDIVPFYGIHSPAVVVSEFILFLQFLMSLYLR